MIQIYADALVTLIQNLKELETAALEWGKFPRRNDRIQQGGEWAGRLMNSAQAMCRVLSFRSAAKQAERIMQRLRAGDCTTDELSSLVSEFHVRIHEDMQEIVFFCVNDQSKVNKFFRQQEPHEVKNGYIQELVFKSADQLFDSRIVARWGEATEDIEEACRCFAFDRFTACAFHLMRVVEIGVLKLGELAGIEDPKPSWGSILGKVERYALRTDYKDLPPALQPHIGLVRELLPEMQAIQRAWRNDKIAHLNDKLVPVKTITEEEALEIMGAVNAFMRTLAEKLPVI